MDEAGEYRGVIEGMGKDDGPKGVEEAQRRLPKAKRRAQSVVQITRVAKEQEKTEGHRDGRKDKRRKRKCPS
jgi:hypothetical protein